MQDILTECRTFVAFRQVYCGGVDWSTPWLCHIHHHLLHTVAATAARPAKAASSAARSADIEICEHRDRQATPRPAPRIAMVGDVKGCNRLLMPTLALWNTSVGNGWRRNTAGGVNDTDICSRSRTHLQKQTSNQVHLQRPPDTCIPGCLRAINFHHQLAGAINFGY